MSKVVFFTWPGGGNQPPAIGIAQELARHGHRVSFAGYPPQVDRFADLGLQLTPMAGASQGLGPVDPSTVMGLLTDRVWACADHPADVHDVLARERPDLLVVDCLMLGVLAAAESAAVPTVVLVHSAPGALAPPHGPLDQLILPTANRIRAALGLDPVDSSWAAWRPHHVVVASVPDLDPIATAVNQTFHPDRFTWIGPVDEDLRPDDTAAARVHQSSPMVLVSFSSGPAWDQTSRIQRTIDALAGDALHVLVTTGSVDPQTLHAPGENIEVVVYRPHAGVLPHVSMVVTHAGHGTLTAALGHALPVVTLPNPAADQPALAHRVAALGAGIDLDGERATPQEIRAAVHLGLDDPTHRRAAAQLALVIKGYQATQPQLAWLP